MFTSIKPREKLIKLGAENLLDAELLAIILRTGKRGKNCVKLAEGLLKKYPLKTLSPEKYIEVSAYPGIGITKACSIFAVLELAHRLKVANTGDSTLYLGPEDFLPLLEDCKNSKKEHVWAFYLNARHTLVHKELILLGSLDGVAINPRDVFEPALTKHACGVVLAHNHPSGDAQPSSSDIEVTTNLSTAGTILGIKLIDHLIVCAADMFSFKAHGLL